MAIEPGEQLSEEPQEERGAKGSRDSGSDAPSEQATARPAGSFDDEVMQSVDESGAETHISGTGELPPADTGSAVPPYEGRKETADDLKQQAAGAGTGVNTAGAAREVADSEFKAPKPSETPRGAEASPADEQPAQDASESEGSDAGVGPSHTAGVRRAES